MVKDNTLLWMALGAWSEGMGADDGNQVYENGLFEDDLKPVLDNIVECRWNLWYAGVYPLRKWEKERIS